jgi:hypothetical protein
LRFLHKTLQNTPKNSVRHQFIRSQCYLAINILTAHTGRNGPEWLKGALWLFFQLAPLPSLSDTNIKPCVRRGLGSKGQSNNLGEIHPLFMAALGNGCWGGGAPLINLLLNLGLTGEIVDWGKHHWRKGSLYANSDALRKIPIEELVNYCCNAIMGFDHICFNIGEPNDKCVKVSWLNFAARMIFERPLISNEATIPSGSKKWLKRTPRYDGSIVQFLIKKHGFTGFTGVDGSTYRFVHANLSYTNVYRLCIVTEDKWVNSPASAEQTRDWLNNIFDNKR